jgi:Mg2+ and Co2+ transporter CorA
MDVRFLTKDGVENQSAQAIPHLLARTDGFVWLDIANCDDAAMQILRDGFDLHPMAIHDCVERNRVPKMHAYPDHILTVLHAPERGHRGHVHYIELDQIVGQNYLITVHGPINPAVKPRVALRETRAVLDRLTTGRLKPTTPIELSHAIISVLIANQEDYIESVTTDVWELEQRVTGGQVTEPEEFLNDLFRARHGLLAVRTMGALSGALYARIAKLSELPANGADLFADAADRFDRVRGVADGEREYLQGVIEFYQTTLVINAALVGQKQNEEIQRLTEASYTQNEEVKKISAWAGIFFAPTLIGTVYGMNFDHMPERHWLIGYPLAILLMVLSSTVLYVVFKRRGWL